MLESTQFLLDRTTVNYLPKVTFESLLECDRRNFNSEISTRSISMTQPTSLTEELQAFATARRAARAPEANKIMDDSTAALEQSGLLENALKVGQAAPDFSLPNVFSKRIQLSNLLQSGPVVLAFYRGAWCPYCNMQLRALQLALPKFRALGASLIAISPQQPDHALSLSEKHALEYDVLFDAGNEVARAFGLAFTLPSALQELYEKMNINLPEQNGADTWELPFAATYVIEPGFTVRLASVNADYTQRLEPSEIVATLRELHD